MVEWTELVERCTEAASVDLGGANDEELCEAMLSLEALRRVVDAAQARVVAEAEARDVCDRRHGLPTSRWLAREAKLAAGTAKQRVAVANTMRRHLGQVHEALGDGRISWDHARVLVDATNPRVVQDVARLQGELLALAEATTFERWRREVTALIAALDQDGAFDPAADLARNRLRVGPVLGGVADLAGTLTTEHALVTAQAIDTVADELFRRYRADHDRCADIEVPDRATLRALALVELCRRGLAVDARTSTPPRTEVVLVAQASDPLSDVATPDGVRLQDGSVRLLECDAAWRALIVDHLGVPLDLGRAARFATPDQRLALTARDGGCVFPGCDAPPRWCDAHHLDHFVRDHGRTDLPVLASLCRYHHRITHRPGWTMHATHDGWFWWTTPSGDCIWSQRHGRRRDGATPEPTARSGARSLPVSAVVMAARRDVIAARARAIDDRGGPAPPAPPGDLDGGEDQARRSRPRPCRRRDRCAGPGRRPRVGEGRSPRSRSPPARLEPFVVDAARWPGLARAWVCLKAGRARRVRECAGPACHHSKHSQERHP